jgi:hypothetical protein
VKCPQFLADFPSLQARKDEHEKHRAELKERLRQDGLWLVYGWKFKTSGDLSNIKQQKIW